jgi:hypothetical protein
MHFSENNFGNFESFTSTYSKANMTSTYSKEEIALEKFHFKIDYSKAKIGGHVSGKVSLVTSSSEPETGLARSTPYKRLTLEKGNKAG